ncbi:MAG: hypothetical protein EXR62_10550 [Chloroflexi bacterium]|nr:hypothetical protein [Chloroflexota bacterium]
MHSMDNNTVVVVVIFALIILAIAVAYRGQIAVKLKGPLGLGLDVKASQPTPPAPGAVSASDITAKQGSVTIAGQTGGDVTATKVVGGGDVSITSSPPPKDSNPKA